MNDIPSDGDRLEALARAYDGDVGSIRTALEQGASMLFTLWGGESSEGTWEDDWCDPPRFFSFFDDDEARRLRFTAFETVGFEILDNSDGEGLHSLVFELRAR